MDPWRNLVDRSNAPVGRQMALILGEGVKKVQNTFVNIALIRLESVKSIGKFTRVFHSLSLFLCARIRVFIPLRIIANSMKVDLEIGLRLGKN